LHFFPTRFPLHYHSSLFSLLFFSFSSRTTAQPESGYCLDLSRSEERHLAKTMIHSAIWEPGENWESGRFNQDRHTPSMPGWILNTSWFHEEGVPRRGLLTFSQYSGEGMLKGGCLPSRQLRNAHMCMVLVDPNEVLYTKLSDTETEEQKSNDYGVSQKDNAYRRPAEISTVGSLKSYDVSAVQEMLTQNCCDLLYSFRRDPPMGPL
jgi:hypothetical protein